MLAGEVRRPRFPIDSPGATGHFPSAGAVSWFADEMTRVYKKDELLGID
jgi:hypothetical protein